MPESFASELSLPIAIYQVGNANFTAKQIKSMVERTNRKLSKAAIRIDVIERVRIGNAKLASVNYDNLEILLSAGQGLEAIRVFLVKEDQTFGWDSWTYDPLEPIFDRSLWGGAVFITESFAESTDRHYAKQGYLPTNDTLLHELGHVLMQESDHYKGKKRNFFHENPDLTDDSISKAQIERMRASPYLRAIPRRLTDKKRETNRGLSKL